MGTVLNVYQAVAEAAVTVVALMQGNAVGFGAALAVTLMQSRFARCDQLTTGLAPLGVRSCWAHAKNPPMQAQLAGSVGRPCEALSLSDGLGVCFLQHHVQLILDV